MELKYVLVMVCVIIPCRSNRTFMELKSIRGEYIGPASLSSNRTFMELKSLSVSSSLWNEARF